MPRGGDPAAEPGPGIAVHGLPSHLRVLRILGRGGMGIVYLVQDTRSDERVAVKVLRDIPGYEEELMTRLGVEARAQMRIRHPNVVRILEAELEADPPYLVMDLVEGRTLQECIEEEGAWPADRAVDVIATLADAVAAVHEAGVLHRDLKPSNVVVRSRDDEPVLMDLGLARVIGESTVTKTGALIGTPAYAPPEVLHGGKFTQASDQYQLAVLLYELLAGQPLIEGRSLDEILASSSEDVAERLDELPVRGQVRRALRRALRSNPTTRHASVAAFAEALRADPEASRIPVPSVDLTAEITQSQRPRQAARRPEPAAQRVPARLLQGGVAGVVFGILTTWFLLSGNAAPEDVRWRVVGDALVLDVVPGGATGLELQLDGAAVETIRQERGDQVRLIHRGLEPELERWARLRWDGGQGPRISVVGVGLALRRDVKLVEAEAIEVEVLRAVSVGWRGRDDRTALGVGTAWLPLPEGPGPFFLEWVEEGIPFHLELDPTALLRDRLAELADRVRELDVLAELERRYQEGGGLGSELPALRREMGALAARLPVALSGRIEGVDPVKLWESLDQILRIAPSARVMGEVVPDMPFPRGAPGCLLYRGPAPPGRSLAVRLEGGGGRVAPDEEFRLTSEPGNRAPPRQEGPTAAGARFAWPGFVDRRAAIVWLRVHKMNPEWCFRIRVEATGSRPAWQAHLWGDPRGSGRDPRYSGWIGFHVPGPLAPAPGTQVGLEYRRLVGEAVDVGVVEAVRVSAAQDIGAARPP